MLKADAITLSSDTPPARVDYIGDLPRSPFWQMPAVGNVVSSSFKNSLTVRHTPTQESYRDGGVLLSQIV